MLQYSIRVTDNNLKIQQPSALHNDPPGYLSVTNALHDWRISLIPPHFVQIVQKIVSSYNNIKQVFEGVWF